MERPSKRGKIPQRDWPLIIKRYEDGETLASIAQTYDCSPPAISYVLSRHRARDENMDTRAKRSIPVLIEERASTTEAAAVAQSKPEAPAAALVGLEARRIDPIDGSARARVPEEEPTLTASERPEPPTYPIPTASEKNGPAKPADDVSPPTLPGDARVRFDGPPQNGEGRRTLHLSLAQDGADRPAMRPDAEQPALAQTGPHRPNFPASAHLSSAPAQHSKEGVTSIDRALRERVDEDIAAFLAAFDAALAQDSLESRAGLREATDRLLRAGARTRIELERLEARVPLSTRVDRANSLPAWRPR